MEPLHGGDGVADDFALDGVVDVVVVQGKVGVAFLLNVVRNVPHQGVEVLGPLDEADGEDQLGVLLVHRLDGDLGLGEHILGA